MSASLDISNLSPAMDSVELGQLLQEYGTVRNAEIVTNDNTRQSRGLGFVEMSSEEEALLAMLALDGTECMGQILSVRQVEPMEGDQDVLPEIGGPHPGGFGDRSGIRPTWGSRS